MVSEPKRQQSFEKYLPWKPENLYIVNLQHIQNYEVLGF